jgi:hypothetical protein
MKTPLLAATMVIAACSHDVSGLPAAPPCTAGGPSSLTLPVGGVAVLSDPNSLACVQIAASPSATAYLFVAANALSVSAAASAYTVEAAVEAGGASTVVATARAAATVNTPEPPARDRAFELRLRAMERRILTLSAARTAWQARGAPTARIAAMPAAPAVGDSLNLRVPDGASTNPCTHYFTVRAVVKAVGAHGVVVQDTAAPAGGFATTDFNSISSEFDTYTYATDTSYFGRPTDLDNNGHVFILYTPRVNALTQRGAASFFAGFFFGGDLFPQTGVGGCAESNVGEIFYLLVPDPAGVFSDARQTTLVRQVTRSTIAHELEHMINLGVRIVESSTNPNITPELIWLDEALAHFGEEYVGRAEDGFTPSQRLTYAAISANTDDYNAFYRNNLTELREWIQRPDTASAIANTDAILPDGGAAWSLLHYTADHYATGALSAFTAALVAGPDSGVPNLTARAVVPFDSLMAGWMVAIYADGLGIPALSSRYSFLSWNYRDAETNGGLAAFPLTITPMATGSTVPTMARPGSGNYFLLNSSPTTPAGRFRLLSPSGSLVSFPGARLYILRTQ